MRHQNRSIQAWLPLFLLGSSAMVDAGCSSDPSHEQPVVRSSSAAVSPTDYYVTTSRNDNYRRGAQTFETVLTPTIVPNLRLLNSFSAPHAGVFYAQPLFYHALVNGVDQNVLIVTSTLTSDNDSTPRTPYVYFLNPRTMAIINSIQLPAMNHLTVNNQHPGVHSTPVIDRASNRLYLVVANDVGGSPRFDLMAYDIGTLTTDGGALTPVAQTRIAGQCAGTPQNHPQIFTEADGNQRGLYLQRPGLLLDNGYIYIAFGGPGIEKDWPYNGWVFAYKTDSVLSTTPRAYCVTRSTGPGSPVGGGGIFQLGVGLASDDANRVYLATGNGLTGTNDDGNSYVQLSKASTWSTTITRSVRPDPHAAFLSNFDLDLSSTGMVVLPFASGARLLGAGKEGMLSVLNPSAADGGLVAVSRFRGAWNQGTPILADPVSNSNLAADGETACTASICTAPPDAGVPTGVPRFGATKKCCTSCNFAGSCGGTEGGYIVHGSMPHIHGAPAFFQTSSNGSGKLFWWAEKDFPRVATWNASTGTLSSVTEAGSRLSTDISDQAPTNKNVDDPTSFMANAMPAGLGSVSSNGMTNGLYWVNVPLGGNTQLGTDNGTGNGSNAWLKAFDANATSPKKHLVQINVGLAENRAYPTIANGTVFLAGAGTVNAYRADLVDVFWRDANGDLIRNRMQGTGTALEQQNLQSGPLGSVPHPVAPGNGIEDVFWRGTDSNLWHTYFLPWAGWQTRTPMTSLPMGQGLGSDPEPISPNTEEIDVFWKRADTSELWHKLYTPSTGWSTELPLASGQMGSSPHAVATGGGVEDVFWRGTDNNLWHVWNVPGVGWQTQPQNLSNLGPTDPGLLQSDPYPTSDGTGMVEVFWLGSGNALYHQKYTPSPSAWGAVGSLPGGTLGSPPHPVATGGGVVDVFWRGTDNNLWHIWFTPAGGWQTAAENLLNAAFDADRALSSEPYPTTFGDGTVNVFWKGRDASLWQKGYVPGVGPGLGWQGLRSLTGSLGSEPHPI